MKLKLLFATEVRASNDAKLERESEHTDNTNDANSSPTASNGLLLKQS